ncbi:MAG: hypothetical protein F4Z28_01185 [Gammaproteobacteria bacterium]|nr:hypothetical protein [Gammaproteobacteria bacterium]
MFSLMRPVGGSASDSAGPFGVGADYRRPFEKESVAHRDPFLVDPAMVDRASRAHAATQNALADRVTGLGLAPLSPGSEDPGYDLAWRTGNDWWVAEVKRLTKSNEEKQLRLGLGQVLRYQDALTRRLARPVRAVLMVEREPADGTWLGLCEALGVFLLWPDSLGRLHGKSSRDTS